MLLHLTNVVLGKLGILVHKQNYSHDYFFLYFIINYGIIIVLIRYITNETKDVDHIGCDGFFFRIRTQVKALVLRY